MENNYRIAIQIGENSFEVESTDVQWVEKKEKEYLNKLNQGTLNPAILGKPDKGTAGFHEKVVPQNLTINEFYNKYLKSGKVKSRPDIAVFFVYYLQKITKKEEIKTQDVTQCFADVGYAGYNKLNMTDILNQGKRKALLNYVNNFWSLTITGEDFVLNTIAGDQNDKK